MLVSVGHEQPDGILEHVFNDLVPGLSPGLGSPRFGLRRVDAAKVLARVAALTTAYEVGGQWGVPSHQSQADAPPQGLPSPPSSPRLQPTGPRLLSLPMPRSLSCPVGGEVFWGGTHV